MIKPENIHCLALNYIGVGIEQQPPLYFVKSLSCLCFSGSIIKYPKDSQRLWTEVELAIVVGRDGEDIHPEEASDYIDGFIVAGDITCENIFKRDHHLGFSKSRTNYCPVSSEIKLVDLDKDTLLITEINGKITQRGHLSEMRYDIYHSLSFVSKITKLKKGDLLLTGTPKGTENNTLNVGDKVKHIIEHVGELYYEIG